MRDFGSMSESLVALNGSSWPLAVIQNGAFQRLRTSANGQERTPVSDQALVLWGVHLFDFSFNELLKWLIEALMSNEEGRLWLDSEDGHVVDAVMPVPNHPGYTDFRLRLLNVSDGGEAEWAALLRAHFEGCEG